MRLTEEQALQDDKRYASCNMLAELKYCGWDIPYRKSITNELIRFHAWLCRSAVALLKEHEAVKPIMEKAVLDYDSWHFVCSNCKKPIDELDNFCRHCGRPIEHT